MQSKLKGIRSFVLRSSVFQLLGFLKIEAHIIWCLCGIIMGQSTGFRQLYRCCPVAGARTEPGRLAVSAPWNFVLHQVVNLLFVDISKKGKCFSLKQFITEHIMN